MLTRTAVTPAFHSKELRGELRLQAIKSSSEFLRPSQDGRTNPALFRIASPYAGHLIVVLCHAGTFSARLRPAIPRRAKRLLCSFSTRDVPILRPIAALPLVEFEAPEPGSLTRRIGSYNVLFLKDGMLAASSIESADGVRKPTRASTE